MAKPDFKDKWVLVTGASSGLGRALAVYLTSVEQAHLVISARRIDQLQQLKKEIESATSRRVEIIPADLTREEDVERLFTEATARAKIFAVINNAGFTHYGISRAANLEIYDNIIAVDVKAVIHLSLKFLAYFQEAGGGAILNITSLGGIIPTPYQCVYAAAKHAIQAFTEALSREYKGSGIAICTFAPGGIATEMITRSGLDRRFGTHSPFHLSAGKAAQKAIKAFKRGKVLYVPGFLNKLILFLHHLLPRRLLLWAAEIIYRPPESPSK